MFSDIGQVQALLKLTFFPRSAYPCRQILLILKKYHRMDFLRALDKLKNSGQCFRTIPKERHAMCSAASKKAFLRTLKP